MVRKKRTPIPKKTAASIMFQTDGICCVCHKEGKPVQIHHIDENPSNNNIENLMTLCLDCHHNTQISGGFTRRLDNEQLKLYRDNWINTISGSRSQLRDEITKSKLKIHHKDEIKPIIISKSTSSTLTQEIRELIKKIGKEKISQLLQEAKLIAIDTNDKEMGNWIQKELNGYTDKQERIKHEKAEKLFPAYRYINTKFVLVASHHDIQEGVTYPIWFVHGIPYIEKCLDSYKKRNIVITIKINLPKKIKGVFGQSVNAIVPEHELESIILGTQRKLSQYLESKLIFEHS